MGKAVKKILFILAGLAGAATLALVFVVFRQETAISMLLVQQAASRERTDSEMQHGLSQLSERVDGISATFSHEIAAGNSGTQGAVRRLQKRLADDISGVRENLADMAVVLNRQAMPPGAAPRAASADVEPVSAEVMEQDLALTQALQRAKSRCGERQFADNGKLIEFLRRNLFTDGKNADGNGQIETRPLLLYVGRREIDRRPACRQPSSRTSGSC